MGASRTLLDGHAPRHEPRVAPTLTHEAAARPRVRATTAARQRPERDAGRHGRAAGLSVDERALLEAVASLAGAAMLLGDGGTVRFASAPGVEGELDRQALEGAMRAAGREAARLAAACRREGIPVLMTLPTARRVLVRGSRCEVRAVRFGARGSVLVTASRVTEAPPSADALREQFGLTKRETEVALLLIERRTAGEIAAALGISEHTARRHTEHVMRKLGVRKRRDVRDALLARGERAARGGGLE